MRRYLQRVVGFNAIQMRLQLSALLDMAAAKPETRHVNNHVNNHVNKLPRGLACIARNRLDRRPPAEDALLRKEYRTSRLKEKVILLVDVRVQQI